MPHESAFNTGLKRYLAKRGFAYAICIPILWFTIVDNRRIFRLISAK